VTREEKMTAILRAAQKAQPLHLGPIDLYDRLATAVEAALEAKDDESPPVPSGPREGEVVTCRICKRAWNADTGTVYCSSLHGVCGICATPRATCKCLRSPVAQPPPPLAPKCGECGRDDCDLMIGDEANHRCGAWEQLSAPTAPVPSGPREGEPRNAAGETAKQVRRRINPPARWPEDDEPPPPLAPKCGEEDEPC
jgi:hypothetical protein